MKVLFVNRFYAPDHSATSQMLTDLATGLAAAGFDAGVVTSRLRYDDPAAALPSHESIDGVEVHRVRTSAFGRGHLPGRAFDYASFYISAAHRLTQLAKAGDVIVAMTDPPLISVVAGWVARSRGARIVNWLQDVFPEVAAEMGMSFARGAGGAVLRRLRNVSLRAASANVVLGRVMHQRIAASGVDPERMAIIANWADGSNVGAIEDDANPLRHEWGLDGKFVVGYSGNMGRVHEFDTIVGAAAALASHPDIVFVFIGGGAQRESVEAAAIRRGVCNVRFRPYQPRERLGLSLGAADVHLITLRPEFEGLVVPSKFYGIAAAGRPSLFIGDPQGEIGTILRETACGICIEQGDVAGLAAAILKLRGDDALRRTMGRAARAQFDEKYDFPIALAAWRALLGNAARGEGSGSG